MYGNMLGSVHAHSGTRSRARTFRAFTTSMRALINFGQYMGGPFDQRLIDDGKKSMTATAISDRLFNIVSTSVASSFVRSLCKFELFLPPPPQKASGEHDIKTEAGVPLRITFSGLLIVDGMESGSGLIISLPPVVSSGDQFGIFRNRTALLS